MRSTRLFEWHMAVNQKRRFNPSKQQDRLEYKHFLEHRSWRSDVCPFILEWPYLTIPDMINDKLTHHMLGAKKRWIND